MLQEYFSNQIRCRADGGVIHSIHIGSKPFSFFPGKIRTSPGIHADMQWNCEDDHLCCTLILHRESTSSSEEAMAAFLVPYPEKQSSLMVWTAREGFPKSICDIGGLDLAYGDVCYGTILPAVTLYDPGKNIGLTVARDPGRTGGRLSFHFDDYHQEGMEVRMNFLQVRPDHPVRIKFRFFGHEGCWRPGLKKYSDLFPEYFQAGNPRANQYRSFVMTNPFFTREAVDALQCDWAEIHNHFPYYGNYLPEEDSWQSVAATDYPESARGRDMTLDREKIRSHIRDLHAKKIQALYYIQCSGDAFIPWAEKTFPESIAKNSAGNLYSTWINCCFCNGDEAYPFGQYLARQWEKIWEVFPEADGLFVDQLCYQAFDYAHDDGKSARGNQSVYEYGASLEKNFQKLAESAHAKDKLVVVNGPFDMEVAKGADAIMSEGVGTIFDTYRYLCLRRKMLVHEFPVSLFAVECMLRNSILSASGWSIGGSPSSAAPMEYPEGTEQIFEKYLPLLGPLRNAELFLGPDPLRWTPREQAKAEIYFDREEGHFLIPVLEGSSFLFSKVSLSVKVPEEEVITDIFVMYPDHPRWEKIAYTEQQGRCVITLKEKFSVCVVKLQTAKKTP